MQRIIKPLLRHPAMPLLLVVQVALACAIAGNAWFMLQQKMAPLMAHVGVGQPQRLLVVTGLRARGTPWPAATLRGLETQLRQLPDVETVSNAATLPMAGQAQMLAYARRPGHHAFVNTSVYVGDNLVKVLGLHLVAGRDFSAAEKATTLNAGMGYHRAGPVIITRALAQRLFPDGPALGHAITFTGSQSQRTVVGIVAHLMRNDLTGDHRHNLDISMLFPGTPARWPAPHFAVRAKHAVDARLIQSVRRLVTQQLGPRLLAGTWPKVERFAVLHAQALAPTRAATWLFAAVTLIVLIVTGTGIAGMTSYQVRQRTRQIGVQRALGAPRRAVVRALQCENLLLMGLGIGVGAMLAFASNAWLIEHYAFSRLPLSLLPAGAAVLIAIGQLAVLVPARKAAGIAPVSALRAI